MLRIENRQVLTEDEFDLKIRPLSPGRHDGSQQITPEFGHGRVRSKRCLRSHVTVSFSGCTNATGATGSGRAVIRATHRCGIDEGKPYLLDGDSGICCGMLAGSPVQAPGPCCCEIELVVRHPAPATPPAPPPPRPAAPTARKRPPVAEICYLPGRDELWFLDADELRELEEAERRTENLLQSLHRAQERGDTQRVEAVDELLKREFLSATAGAVTDLTEIRRLRGNKWTYVGSGKRKGKKHLRRYSLDADDRKGHKLTTNGKLDAKKIKRELTRWSAKSKLEFSDQFAEELASWETEWLIPWRRADLEVDANAAFLRYLFEASASGEIDMKERRLRASANGTARLSITEGKAKISLLFPDDDGWPCVCDCQGTRLDFGVFRASVGAEVEAFVGVAVMLGTKVEAAIPPGKPLELKFTGDGEAFAGARVGFEFALALQWARASDLGEWLGLAKGAYGASVQVGIGAKIGFRLEWNKGRFMLRLHAGLVIGWGAEGEFLVELDLKHLARLVLVILENLRNIDYHQLLQVDVPAFPVMCDALVWQLVSGEALAEFSAEKSQEIRGWWRNEQRRKAVAERLRAAPALFRLAPPEVKGPLVCAFCHEAQRDADTVMRILETIQNQREYTLVLQRMTTDGTRIAVEQGEQKLASLLNGRQWDRFLA